MFRKVLIFVLCFVTCGGAYAATDKGLVERAEKYLNSITGLSGGFVRRPMERVQKVLFPCCARARFVWIMTICLCR